MYTVTEYHHPTNFMPSLYGVAVVLLVILTSSAVFGHGGQSHAEQAFTNFKAMEKAMEIFDQLLAAGKLDESWETGLQEVSVSVRQESDGQKSVVRFTRPAGDPKTLFLFFNAEGEYAGANYTGQ